VAFSLRKRVSVIASVLLLGFPTVVGSASLGTTAWAGVVTASSVIRTAKLAIAKQASAHVVFIAHSSSPSKTEKIVADVGRISGTESIVEGTAHLTVKLSSTHAYVSGNSSGLTTLFGMSSTDAKKIGTEWESWTAGTSQYANLKLDLTMSSVAALFPKAKATKLSTVVTGKTTYHLLKWMIPATTSLPKVMNTLTISTGAMTLPVTETAIVSGVTKATTRLSRWGEQVVVGIPSAAVTIPSSRTTG
jgi:hypothetical protein